jgi:ATP-dependent Lon protease
MSSTLPVLALKNTVVYPQIVLPLAVGRAQSLAAVRAASERGQQLLTAAQLAEDAEQPGQSELHEIGTLVSLTRVEERAKGLQVIVQGVRRVRFLAPEAAGESAGSADPTPAEFLDLPYELLPELSIDVDDPAQAGAVALLRENLDLAQQIANLFDSDNGSQIYQQLVGSINDPITQMYRIASLANLTVAQQQQVLACNDTDSLMRTVHEVLQHELQVTELRREIAEQARTDIDQQQREHVLRQQKRAIEEALGESDEDGDLQELRAQLDARELPEPVRKEVDRELTRLGRMSPNAADYQVARSYLELVAELPWHEASEDRLDMTNAREVLDADHFGLEDIKDRVLESLAVMALNPEARAPILCLVGPPGVGKTSLGQSIARAMGRIFERLSLGGLHDEAELRGHRRTYIGAMPGRILQAIRRAGVVNPLIMLDEVDKLGQDFRGDPSAALMEILDPAQNDAFRDNFLNLPYDLSGVMFITTANSLESIPGPLRDRMEVLELGGYTDSEKQAIAERYLVPRQQEEAGLTQAQFRLSAEAIRLAIRGYTREAGVRELERVIGRLARKRARAVLAEREGANAASGSEPAPANTVAEITDDVVIELLGPRRFKEDPRRQSLPSGVAAGLAWTAVGGDVLYVEATLIDKKQPITLTGQLGEVMQESARAAKSHIWSAAESYGIDRARIEANGVHIHLPAGAIPKDGPSAGITMATAIASAYSERAVHDDLAMTGELTLTGMVLPVGGIKEKLLAAHRAGMRRILLPQDNAADLEKLPDEIRSDLDITLVSHLHEVFDLAFQTAQPAS